LDHGANIEDRDDNGFTPLFEAVDCGNVENVRLLLSSGAVVNVSSSDG